MKYELKKVIGHKLIWICFILLIILYAYTSMYYTKVKYYYELDENYRIMRQQEMFQQVETYRNTVVKNAKRLVKSKDSYVSEMNQNLLERYSEPIALTEYDSRCVESILDNCGGICMVLCIFISCIFALKIFHVDTDNDMTGMIASSPKGNIHIYLNKWLCIIMIEIILLIVAFLIRLTPLLAYGEISDLFNPIQSMEVYSKSPYNLSVLEYYLLTMVIAFIEMTIISAICVIIISLFKDIIIPIVISVLLSAGSMIVNMWILLSITGGTSMVDSTSAVVDIIIKYTPILYIHNVKEYFSSAQYVNVFGMPITLLSMSLVVNLITSIILVVLGYYFYTRRQKRTA